MTSHAPTTMPSTPAAGAVLDGKYRLEVELGRGGMGVVFRARHIKLNKPVAIKMLLPDALQAPDAVERFDREARAAAQIKSQYVAEVLDVGSHQGLPFMVMEFLEGNDLSVELTQRGPLPATEVIGWLLQVCEAMSDAHARGIIHRDLKPSNLFLQKQGDTRVLKILDFGISKITTPGEVNLTATSTGFGTAHYISPEQIRSARKADARSDVWSLGVIAYELLSGSPPFLGESAQSIIAAILTDAPIPLGRHRPDLHPALTEAIHKTLAKDREKRTPSMAAFAEGLRPFLGEGPPSQPAGDTDAVTLRKLPLPGSGAAWVGVMALMGLVFVAGAGLRKRLNSNEPGATAEAGAREASVSPPASASVAATSTVSAPIPASAAASAGPAASAPTKKASGQTTKTKTAPPSTTRTGRLD